MLLRISSSSVTATTAPPSYCDSCCQIAPLTPTLPLPDTSVGEALYGGESRDYLEGVDIPLDRCAQWRWQAGGFGWMLASLRDLSKTGCRGRPSNGEAFPSRATRLLRIEWSLVMIALARTSFLVVRRVVIQRRAVERTASLVISSLTCTLHFSQMPSTWHSQLRSRYACSPSWRLPTLSRQRAHTHAAHGRRFVQEEARTKLDTHTHKHTQTHSLTHQCIPPSEKSVNLNNSFFITSSKLFFVLDI